MSVLMRIFIVLFIIFLFAPIFLLPIFAFNDSAVIALPLSGFTTRWFGELLQNAQLQQATFNSLRIALTVAVLATTLAVLAARASTRYNFRGKAIVIGTIMLPIALPEIIVGISLLVVILQMGLKLSLWTIVLGHTLMATPFCVAVLRSAFQQLDPSLEEASLDLGQSRMATFMRITLPLVMPGLISSFLLAFIISLDEFVIAFFLSGTDTTLPVYIWGQLRFPQKIPSVMALGTLLLLLSIALLSLAELASRASRKRLSTERRNSINP